MEKNMEKKRSETEDKNIGIPDVFRSSGFVEWDGIFRADAHLRGTLRRHSAASAASS